MQAAAGSNVVTASSQRNPVTGAIALTSQTVGAYGALQPARDVLSLLCAGPGILKLGGTENSKTDMVRSQSEEVSRKRISRPAYLKGSSEILVPIFPI